MHNSCFSFKELKFYLIENDCKCIFDEEAINVEKNAGKGEDEPKEKIAGKTLNELAKRLVQFVEFKFVSPTRDEVYSVCQSVIEIFTTIGGIVRFF